MTIILPILVYLVCGIFAACYLHDDLGMKTGHSLLGGVIWPFIAYRAIRNGYLTSFVKELDEATRNR
jgi:hypothetical protein